MPVDPSSPDSIEKRFRYQLAEAAQAGFAADNAVHGGGLLVAWNELAPVRRRELILATELIRTAYLSHRDGAFNPAFDACNKNWYLRISYVFIGAVIGFYREWQA